MKLIFSALILVAAPSLASIFGPSSYDDCITSSMKGVTSDIAARAIIASCREKFPATEPVTDKITGTKATEILSSARISSVPPNYFGPTTSDHEVRFHNPLDKYIKYITIAVEVDNSPAVLFRSYAGAKPLSRGNAYYYLDLPKDAKITAWWLHEIEVSDQ